MAYGPHKSAQIIQVSVSNSDKISSKRFVPFLLLVDKDKVGLVGQQKAVTSSCRPKRFVFRNLHSSRCPVAPSVKHFPPDMAVVPHFESCVLPVATTWILKRLVPWRWINRNIMSLCLCSCFSAVDGQNPAPVGVLTSVVVCDAFCIVYCNNSFIHFIYRQVRVIVFINRTRIAQASPKSPHLRGRNLEFWKCQGTWLLDPWRQRRSFLQFLDHWGTTLCKAWSFIFIYSWRPVIPTKGKTSL